MIFKKRKKIKSGIAISNWQLAVGYWQLAVDN